jgi:radical SAM family uncharacterized protein/radical SAM-linked protein
MVSLQSSIERDILPTVIKPSRYTGNELNVIHKDHSRVDVKVALAFPDTYELGMSYLGFAILYHLFNRRPDVLAERVFAPWVDMEAILRQREIPLFSLESKRSLRSFDIIAFTLPYELCYTNILNMLELARIPLKGEDRSDEDPLIIAGGMGAYNPEPLADFIDAFVIGDGEDVIHEIVDTLNALKGLSRYKRLQALSERKGIYVPSLYAPDGRKGRFLCVAPVDLRAPKRIDSRTVTILSPEYYSDKPLVPFTEIEHDRLTIEIMRGCPRGCRFCNASILYRPVRERPMEDILGQAERSIANTGHNEISLLALSATDYSNIEELLGALNNRLAAKRVALALPSLRPDTFSKHLAESVQTVRKSGLTFAPEAGTERLRRAINKRIRDDDLFEAVEMAYEKGWNLIKLYFMIGLPTEEQEDIEAIVHLVRDVVTLGKRIGGDKHVNVAISPFSPKAHTPFQWAAQDPIERLHEKTTYLREQLQHRRINVKWRAPEVACVENIFARGDRRLSKTLFQARQSGCRLDGWSDFFSYALWEEAFEKSDIDPHVYTSQINMDQSLPWEHIAVGLSKDTLAREWEQTQAGGEDAYPMMVSPQKRKHEGSERSLPDNHLVDTVAGAIDSPYGRSRRKRTKTPLQVAKVRIRMKYTKSVAVRFLSHLDLVRAFERAMRRAALPVAYSQGFHPHPKMAFGPPLALGMTSQAEYVDIQFEQPYSQTMIDSLNHAFPHGLHILQAKPIFGKTPSLSSIIHQAEYLVTLDQLLTQQQMEEAIQALLRHSEIWVQRQGKGQTKEVDIRPYILAMAPLAGDEETALRLHLRTSDTGHAKPNEVMSQFLSRPLSELATLRVERLEQFAEKDGQLVSPMDCV